MGSRAPRVRVLVVDDDPGILRMAERYLAAKGLEVSISDSPFGVSSQVTRERPDVVVLDLMMPALSGDALAQLLAALPHAVGIVLYSAVDEDELRRVTEKIPGAIGVSKTAGLEALFRAVSEAAIH